MRALGITSAAILSLPLAVAAPAWAQEQHEQEQKDRPAQQEEKKTLPEKSEKQAEKPAVQQEKGAKPEERNAQQRTIQAQRADGRIPDDRFKADFGRQHTFRVSQGDYRNHRFQYGGYSFGFVDAWPSNWLYTQNVYVVEINGTYYLCNPAIPARKSYAQHRAVAALPAWPRSYSRSARTDLEHAPFANIRRCHNPERRLLTVAALFFIVVRCSAGAAASLSCDSRGIVDLT